MILDRSHTIVYTPPHMVKRAVDIYSGGWDGRHCAFIYTVATLLDFPVVPIFKGENT